MHIILYINSRLPNYSSHHIRKTTFHAVAIPSWSVMADLKCLGTLGLVLWLALLTGKLFSVNYRMLDHILCLLTQEMKAHYQEDGKIGTTLNESLEYSPATAEDTWFYLNIKDPATMDGVVERLRVCYTLEEEIYQNHMQETLYQGTIGFYRYNTEQEAYSLLNFTSITVKRTHKNLTCETIDITRSEVLKGDVIGVCARNFNSSVRRINFVAEGDHRHFLKVEEVDDQDYFCTDVGQVPSTLHYLDFRSEYILRISGIIDDGEYYQCKKIEL
jgi:hypothetical protein